LLSENKSRTGVTFYIEFNNNKSSRQIQFLYFFKIFIKKALLWLQGLWLFFFIHVMEVLP